MLEYKCISEQLGVSLYQAVLLLALRDYPVMNYEISEILKIYPKSKMRKRVLEPLRNAGWIVFYSVSPDNGQVGAPKLAWSLRSDKRAQFEAGIVLAEESMSKRLHAAKLLSEDLKKALCIA